MVGSGKKKAHSRVGKKYWKQCEQCRTEYLSDLLNYSVMRKIIFLSKRCNPTMSVERHFFYCSYFNQTNRVILITNFLSQILCYPFLCR
ncbi:hypothetical protein FYF90_17570 [Enterobacter sp. RVSM5a]|nr:hypothetical protein FYF90_17570 [Enterobacter sp. RVSM5a]